jgi:epoxyqueuosine reductase
LKTSIRERATELGFDACGFAGAAAPDNAAQFQRWLASNFHGEMGYLARNAAKRVDPELVLRDAKTVIAVAASYYNSADAPEGSRFSPNAARADSPAGVIARYARHADYHAVIGERLAALTAFVNEAGGPGTRSLWYVDTGPILERDFAQRAGIGFIGKHTNVISRRLGNWIFLGEIITTAAMQPDAPERNRCGSCHRCIDACPTEAIRGPFQLDARRCISYLTIELKGAIPVEFRPAIGNRIYGCDDCLAACPWNRFAREGAMMRPQRRADMASPQLTELLALDEDGFKRKFAGTPMLRTKRRGFLRNVCVALGNVGDASALAALSRAAGDAEPLIAEHARWAIARIESRSGTGAVVSPAAEKNASTNISATGAEQFALIAAKKKSGMAQPEKHFVGVDGIRHDVGTILDGREICHGRPDCAGAGVGGEFELEACGVGGPGEHQRIVGLERGVERNRDRNGGERNVASVTDAGGIGGDGLEMECGSGREASDGG